MKIGYPCINHEVGCTSHGTFRLRSYSEQRLIETVKSNLDCLTKILKFNVQHELHFFRISSDIIPFASHEICQFDWLSFFSKQLQKIGEFIREHHLRISMHPDQFVLINALDEIIVNRSIKELEWHCRFLDAMHINDAAKVQIHIGGVYGDKQKSMQRFIEIYSGLPDFVKKRLVIENDDRLFDLSDCLFISEQVGTPIVFDSFHHTRLNQGESMQQALQIAIATWQPQDGLAMVDYSSQAPDERLGKHADALDEQDFEQFIELTQAFDFDVMLEIKDKEKSALKAVAIAKKFRELSDT